MALVPYYFFDLALAIITSSKLHTVIGARARACWHGDAIHPVLREVGPGAGDSETSLQSLFSTTISDRNSEKSHSRSDTRARRRHIRP